MKRLLTLACAAAILSAGAVRAASARVDGRYWQAIDAKWGRAGQAVKTNYLLGVLDGFHFMIDRAAQPEGAPVFQRQDVGEIVSALDAFYSNPRNTVIPVVYALSIVEMQMQGVDQETVQQAISEKRQFWAEDAPGSR